MTFNAQAGTDLGESFDLTFRMCGSTVPGKRSRASRCRTATCGRTPAPSSAGASTRGAGWPSPMASSRGTASSARGSPGRRLRPADFTTFLGGLPLGTRPAAQDFNNYEDTELTAALAKLGDKINNRFSLGLGYLWGTTRSTASSCRICRTTCRERCCSTPTTATTKNRCSTSMSVYGSEAHAAGPVEAGLAGFQKKAAPGTGRLSFIRDCRLFTSFKAPGNRSGRLSSVGSVCSLQ